jgi:hypothetical protein
VIFPQLSEMDRISLVEPFSEEEVKEVVQQCEGNKSYGPDGFNFSFVKKFWHIIKDDILRCVKDFQWNCSFPRGCNASLFTLIPKNDNPQHLGEYRPIFLVGCLYKIISKCLVSRLKSVIHSIIAVTQSAFVGSRNMLGGVVVANETIDFVKKI